MEKCFSTLVIGERCVSDCAPRRAARTVRVRKLVASFLATAIITVAAAQAANQPGQGGGDGGGGGATPTAPPGSLCYFSGGWGSNFGLSTDITGTKATLDATLPAPGSYKMETRAVATGADGSITYDSGWMEDTGSGVWIPGGQTVGDSLFIPSNPDMSGGFTITERFTDAGGQTHDADGMAFPPDPITNTC